MRSLAIVLTVLLVLVVAVAAPPALRFRSGVTQATNVDPVCADPRVISAVHRSIGASRYGYSAVSNLLAFRLSHSVEERGTLGSSLDRWAMARLGQLVTPRRRIDAAFCSGGNAGGRRRNLPALGRIVGLPDLRTVSDCRLDVLGGVLATDLSRSRTDPEIREFFGSRASACAA
jgi:hypothetical protein